jgi:hypothetical protein
VVVFRATVLSVVLLFAAGPSALVLCKALCDPHAAAANGCRHQDNGTASQVSGNASCQDMALGVSALLKENVRRGASAGVGGAAVLVATFEFVTTTSRVHPVHGAERGTSDQKRPLSTPLRI